MHVNRLTYVLVPDLQIVLMQTCTVFFMRFLDQKAQIPSALLQCDDCYSYVVINHILPVELYFDHRILEPDFSVKLYLVLLLTPTWHRLNIVAQLILWTGRQLAYPLRALNTDNTAISGRKIGMEIEVWTLS
jgi:hypothetical protein